MVGGKWESNSVCPAPLKTDSRWESPSRVVSQSSSNEHASCSPLSLSLCYRHTHTVKALAIRPRAAGPSVWMCSAYQSRPNGKKEEDWEWKRRVGPYTQSYSGASFNLILIDFISVPPPLLLPSYNEALSPLGFFCLRYPPQSATADLDQSLCWKNEKEKEKRKTKSKGST